MRFGLVVNQSQLALLSHLLSLKLGGPLMSTCFDPFGHAKWGMSLAGKVFLKLWKCPLHCFLIVVTIFRSFFSILAPDKFSILWICHPHNSNIEIPLPLKGFDLKVAEFFHLFSGQWPDWPKKWSSNCHGWKPKKFQYLTLDPSSPPPTYIPLWYLWAVFGQLIKIPIFENVSRFRMS